jgi:molybdenum cofactor cytidylyltransferase
MKQQGVSAILLAAGESHRMGAVNKLTLQVGDMPLLRRTTLTLLEASLEEVVVVLGYEADTCAPLLDDLPVRTVVNQHYREGRMSSVDCGMQALRQPAAGFMVCLGDQPLLDTSDIDTLVAAFLSQCPGSVLVPQFHGRRGNPVIVADRHRKAILAGGRRLGCRHFIDSHPELVWHHEMPNDHCVFDLDTPQDYALLLKRTTNATQASSL